MTAATYYPEHSDLRQGLDAIIVSPTSEITVADAREEAGDEGMGPLLRGGA